MTEVSKQANIEQIESGKKVKDKLRIIDKLLNRDYTIPEIMKSLNLISNTASARLSELEEDGIVKVIGKRKIKKRSYSVYSLVDSEFIKDEKQKCRIRRALRKLKGVVKYYDLFTPDLKINLMVNMKRLSGIQNKTT